MTDPRQPDDDQLLSTRQVLRETGLTRQQLYSYINAGLVTPAGRTATGRWRFAPSARARLEIIRSLNRSGYALRDIRETFRSAFS
jgi:DNA-binding transcriptional MerR regulator